MDAGGVASAAAHLIEELAGLLGHLRKGLERGVERRKRVRLPGQLLVRPHRERQAHANLRTTSSASANEHCSMVGLTLPAAPENAATRAPRSSTRNSRSHSWPPPLAYLAIHVRQPGGSGARARARRLPVEDLIRAFLALEDVCKVDVLVHDRLLLSRSSPQTHVHRGAQCKEVGAHVHRQEAP